MMPRAALLALFVLLVGNAGQARASERVVPPGWLGVTADGPFDPGNDREWDRMARAGVESVRAAFEWARVQPLPPSGSDVASDFRSTDLLAIEAARHGISLLPVVQVPPFWAAVPPGQLGSPPADMDAVRRFFATLVERYGPRGSLWRERPNLPRVPIRAWQVFNEPNRVYYWTVQPFANDYAATLEAAASGIRNVDPDATVVLGGLPNRSWEALAAIYAAGGGGAFDAAAVHPYTSSPANVLRVVRNVRHVMRINGDGSLPIWVTEFSWPATGLLRNMPDWVAETFGEPISDMKQARLLSRSVGRLAAARERLGIARVDWYTWVSSNAADSNNPFDYSGLRRIRDGVSRNAPAMRAFRRWARRLEGCAKTANSQRCR